MSAVPTPHAWMVGHWYIPCSDDHTQLVVGEWGEPSITPTIAPPALVGTASRSPQILKVHAPMFELSVANKIQFTPVTDPPFRHTVQMVYLLDRDQRIWLTQYDFDCVFADWGEAVAYRNALWAEIKRDHDASPALLLKSGRSATLPLAA